MERVAASFGNSRFNSNLSSSIHKDHAENIPNITYNNNNNHGNLQQKSNLTSNTLNVYSTNNENNFKSPLHTLSSISSMKRKSSRTDLNTNNKVHLRRQSNSFADTPGQISLDKSVKTTSINTIATTTVAPLSERTQSSLDHDTNTAQLPVLVLAPFEPSPWIEFGKVVIGTKKTMTMVIQNPSDTIERIALDPGCKMEEKGFNISQLDPLQSGSKNGAVEPLLLKPRSKIEINICWTPLTNGNIRASAVLKTSSGRFMVNLRGCGETPILEYLSSSRKPSASGNRTSIQGSVTAGRKYDNLKQSTMRSSVARPNTSNFPPAPGGYNTLPYVTTNDMYDEKWIDKQEQSFSQWLNHEFNVTVDSFSPKDPSSWSYYSHKLEFEHTRAAACKIYQSDTFRIVLRKVEDSIGRDRLQLRPDVNLVGEIGTRREIIDLFFSFDIRWLVLGLETITGKETSINPNFDRATISGFINKAIFHDKQIEAEYEPDRVLSNRPKFHQAMNRLVLKRLFMLILFLDKAKNARLIPSDPCLFNKESDIKSSRTLLLIISKNYLLGEGDIIRHLLFMGYSVLHVQTPLDEFDYTVRNLAVDLRDGVRLCRLIDLHCPELDLCSKMKFPTLSKTQMQQNVSLALNTLVGQGIALEGTRGGVVGPRDIVEGHREKTFGLLWKLILNWKVSVLLDLKVLNSEIESLKMEYKRIHGVDQPDRVETVYFTSDQLSALLRWCQAIGAFYNLAVENFTTSFSDGRAFGALLSYYHPTLLDMNDMKDSAKFLREYKEGLHQLEHQAPENGKSWFIDTKDIKDPVTRGKEMDRFNYRLLHNKVQALGGVPISLRHSDMSNIGVPDEKAVILFVTYLCARLMHLNRDIRAAKTIQRIWRKKHYGRKETSRIDATIVIQKHIRGFLTRKHTSVQSKIRNDAALLIQTGCRMYLAQTQAIYRLESVITIQTQCRAFLARKQHIETQWAALTLQRYYRGYVARRHFRIVLNAHRATLIVQAQARGYLIRKQYVLMRLAAEVIQSRRRAIVEARRVRGLYLRLSDASITIQRHWRAYLAARDARQAYLQKRELAIKLQTLIRSKLMQRLFIKKQEAAIVIQRKLRERNLVKQHQYQFQMQQWAVSVIQQRWRAILVGRQVRYHYQLLRWGAIRIQSFSRAIMVRRQLAEIHYAALTIQRRRRAFVEGQNQRHQYALTYAATLIIQRRWRALLLARKVREEYVETRSAVIGIQATIRGFMLRQRLIQVMRQNQACIVIQSTWRACVQRREYLRYKGAAIMIQRFWRATQLRRLEQHEFQMKQWGVAVIKQWWRACKLGLDVRERYQRLREAAIVIQSLQRGRIARRQAQALRVIVGVQSIVRMRIARHNFERLQAASIIIQRKWRARQWGIEQRNMYDNLRWAALVIQSRWRTIREIRKAQYEYQALRGSVIGIQTQYRGSTVRHQYLELKWATVVTQQRWRALIEGRRVREEYSTIRAAAQIIQSTWRSVQLARAQRRAYLQLRAQILADKERNAAAVLIQTAIRGALVRNAVRQHIEDRERIMIRWVEVATLSISAIQIQRCWRQYHSRRLAELHNTAALILQQKWRQRAEARKVDRLNLLALMLQTQIRGVLARQEFDNRQLAIIKLQAWWRGHQVRQDCSAKIKAARKRIEHANATAEEHMKLGNRTTMALDMILSSGQLSAVLKACYHLDVVTRLSKNSCLRLVEHNVVNIIFQLIKSCNRSQPHMEVLKHGLNIIENLSRDIDTIGAVFWAPESMEILVDCSQAYRENEMVFESVVTILLIHLEHDQSRRGILRSMEPEVKKLRGVLTVMERKVEREMRSKSIYMAPGKPVRLLVSSVGKLRKIVELLQ